MTCRSRQHCTYDVNVIRDTANASQLIFPILQHLLVFVALYAIFPLPTFAQIVARWDADVDGDWNDPSKWSTAHFPNNGVPDPLDVYNVVIDATGNDYTIRLEEDVNINHLIFDSADATLDQFQATISASNGFDLFNETYDFSSGVILNANLRISHSFALMMGSYFYTPTLDGVTFSGDGTVATTS